MIFDPVVVVGSLDDDVPVALALLVAEEIDGVLTR
jgi:hypothetical protein